MKESKRLKELYNYKVLDTPSEKKLDDIVEIATALCDTPISLVSLVDSDRQWFKAKKGLEISQTRREDFFCNHALQSPNEILVVNDPLNDSRFANNPLVKGNPNIRYYAGAPLRTKEGHVLGTLCVMDDKPRKIGEKKLAALKLLSNEVMEYLETRRLLMRQSETLQKKSADLINFSRQSKSVFLQFEVSSKGKIAFNFISQEIQKINPILTPKVLKKHPKKVLDVIHPDDCDYVLKSILESSLNCKNWETEFRIKRADGSYSWYLGIAKPEKTANGSIFWYGTFQDVSNKKEYTNALEQMSFDISHVLRKPITTLMSIISVIEIEKDLDKESLKMYATYLKSVGEELDEFTKMLNDTYHKKWMRLKG
ncbi:GAF domain-containing protein [Maribacter sp. 2210JD10-5]|uniref:GAF domain-containing protein n=1 Tax=Maribacter sp. 2210JD10-5 TaxID=3386272 RepID=UPI0039BCF8DE